MIKAGNARFKEGTWLVAETCWFETINEVI